MSAALSILAGTGVGARLVGSIFGNSQARSSAEAQENAAQIQLDAARVNQGIYYDRAKTAERNAEHAQWQGRFTASRIRSQQRINTALGAIEYSETLRAADVVERSAKRSFDFAQSQAEALRADAAEVRDVASERNDRQFREGRDFLGRERQATASAGFTQSGSELDRLVESAERLELERLDTARQAASEARRINFGADVAEFEGEMALFAGEEEGRQLRFTAEIGKFMTAVDAWNAEQEALVSIYEGRVQAANLLDEARDLRTQGDLALKYGQAAYQSAIAGANATRTEGRMGIFSAIGQGARDAGGFILNRER